MTHLSRLAFFLFTLALFIHSAALFAHHEGVHHEGPLSHLKKRIIRAKGDHNFPPYEFINEAGEADGFNVELFKEVMHRLGLGYELTLEEWGKVRGELDNGEIDMLIGLINSSDRARKARFGVPHCLINFNVISRKDEPYSSITSLQGKEVMVQYKDHAHEYLINNRITDSITTVTSVEEGLQLLSAGKCDAFISLTMASYYHIRKEKYSNLKSTEADILPQYYSMAVSPDNEELLFLLNNAIYEMKIDGTYDLLYYKWFNVYEKSDAYYKVRYIVFSFVAISIILVFFIWLLRSRVRMSTEKIRKSNQETLRLVAQLQEENRMRVAVEKSLLMAKQKAEASERLKSAFLANMSHEIRTPLNAIVGFSELLKYTDDQQEKEEYIEIINTNNELLLQLISDILDISKIESGTLKLHPSILDVTEFIKEIYTTHKLRCEVKGIELLLELPRERYIVTLDKNKTLQVVTNYLNNAIKFTRKGHIKLGYTYRDAGVLFFVEDTGIGLSPQNLNHLFQRFEKLDTFAQGTGLGLSICKGLVENMGGRVWAESEEGKGATFFA